MNNNYQESSKGYDNSKKEKDQSFTIEPLGLRWVSNSKYSDQNEQ